MSRFHTVKHKFVQFVPDVLEPGTVYVSIDYATSIHKCLCGCGLEVVTPISPTDWKLIFDGVSVSLHPSIGNWAFPCQSHYWIDHNRVKWAEGWTFEQIEKARKQDFQIKSGYFNELASVPSQPPKVVQTSSNVSSNQSFWARLRNRLRFK